MGLRSRTALAMISLVVVTAIVIGVVAYRGAYSLALRSGQDQQRDYAQRLGTRLLTYIANARADVLACARFPMIGAIVSPAPTAEGEANVEQARASLAEIFRAELRAKPNYIQFRLVGLPDNGREIVRVDRSGTGGAIRTVPDRELQAKSARDYFAPALKTPPGQVYVSALNLNRERGQLEVPHLPVLRMATPVTGRDASPAGFLIINIDMRPELDNLRASGFEHGSMMLVNDSGDYLVNPDRSKEFGFDLSKRHRLSDDFPALARSLPADTQSTTILAKSAAAPEGASFVVEPIQLGEGRLVYLISATPVESLFNAGHAIVRSILIGGGVALIGAIFASLLLARSIAGPISKIAEGIEDASAGRPVRLPTSAGGEEGALARAFKRYFDAERLYEAAVKSSNEAILTKSLDGTITSWNPACERLYGYSASEAIGKHISTIAPERKRDELNEILLRVAGGETIEDFETLRRNRLGRVFPVSLNISPVRSMDGEIIGASSIARDISDRYERERRLREMQTSMWREGRIMAAGQMAAGLGHELNQPLASVQNYINAARRWLAREELGVARARDELEKASGQIERMTRIIQRLRDFVRNRPTRLAMEDLNAVVTEAVSFARMESGTRAAEISLELTQQQLLVMIDKVQIQQAVINLIRNACEAVKHQAEQRVIVRTELKTDIRAAEISVSDNGPGLSEDIKNRLFEPFTTTKDRGTGVGLMICRSIIEAHDGALWHTANADAGTTFHLRIPFQSELSLTA